MNSTFAAAPNLVEVLLARAELTPHAIALRFLDERGEHPLSYQQLHQRARALAVRLAEQVCAGERAVLLLPTGAEYVVAFFACLYAGVIAVPAYPPESLRAQHLARLNSILADAQPRWILTDSTLLGSLTTVFASDSDGPKLLAVDDVDQNLAPDWRKPVIADCDIAFLQYTSGSTSDPKGVQVSHGNLIANERLIREGFSITEQDVFVSWLPLFHDMGLIGVLLQSIYTGIPCVLMAPQYFLERPRRWLEAISQYRATISGGPDFGYRLARDRVKQSALEGLDLSSWRLAFSGSEPIRPDTLEGFAEHFAPIGFQRSAYLACYGLAEATLYVTGGQRGRGIDLLRLDSTALAANHVLPGTDRQWVNCGRLQAQHPLCIVEPARLDELGENRVGEIWASGPSIASGYWRNPQASAKTFVQRNGQTWLRTGDLGFLQGGELFVTGRLKDLIIVRGQNLYPQDLERVVEEQVEGARKGRVAAFAVEHNRQEGIGIAVEINRAVRKHRPASELVQAIGAALAGSFQEAPCWVALLEPGTLPKTSSGKLQRSACYRNLLDGSLQPYAFQRPGHAVGEALARLPLNAAEQAMGELWCELLTMEAVHTADNFFALGGNSITAAQLIARLRERIPAVELRLLFDTPTLGAFVAALGALPAEALAPILRLPRGGPLPISMAQRRLWFLHKLAPHSSAYTISGRLRVRGPLRVTRVRQAFEQLIARHESLRTVLRENATGEAMQVILEQGPLQLEQHGNPEAFAARPFDLENGPLLRVLVQNLGEQRHELLVCIHHIVADGWSMNLLLDEFAELYQGNSLAELPAQYADVAAWQQQQLGTGEALLGYWKNHLAGVPGSLQLPADRPHPAQRDGAASVLGINLDPALAERLRQLAEDHAVTLPTLLLASFVALLGRYSNQADICVGVTHAGRSSLASERLIGFFVNMLVLRADLGADPTFAALLTHFQRLSQQAQAHAALPFDQLVEALQPERAAGRHPFFQAAFDHQWQPATRETLADLRIETMEQLRLATPFDLVLHCRETPTQLTASFCYAQDLFDPPTIARLASHWLNLLRGAVAQPELPVSRLPLLDADEQQDLLVACNQRPRHASLPPPFGDSLQQRFEHQASARPHAIALSGEGWQLTYAELNRRANRLAWKLRELGVGPDLLVGLTVQRDVAMLIGMLAILKAGAAYLPLDPGYPADRLTYMVEDSGIDLLLCHGDLPALIDVQMLVLDNDDQAFKSYPEHNLPLLGSDQNLAYCIYTSGSTGQPKGVLISHANAVRLFQASAADMHCDEHDVWTLFHSGAFDFSVWEIFGALLHGGRLVVVEHYTSRAPELFHALLVREKVTVLSQTPSAFRQLINVAVASDLPLALRYVVFGGEALEVSSLRPWFKRFGDRQPLLVNMYGITETTVHVSFQPVTAASIGFNSSPIGVPLADLQWFLLDAALQPVPIGVSGELHVAGAGLARGYLNRPGLSAERFIANPFGEPGSRLYRSGDLARLRADGSLEYLGRADQQVKVRGFRIELGEIEAQLLAVPGVREAVVLAQDGERLLGFLVATEGVDLNAIRRHLRASLPEHMQPASLHCLPNLPLTSNGKLDRKALLALRPDIPQPMGEAPHAGLESQLAQLWCDVLGVSQVQRHDNFFELGGHSLLATRLVAAIATRFDVRLELRRFFEARDFAELAAAVAEQQSSALGSQALNDELAAALALVAGLSTEDLASLAAPNEKVLP